MLGTNAKRQFAEMHNNIQYTKQQQKKRRKRQTVTIVKSQKYLTLQKNIFIVFLTIVIFSLENF